MKSEEEINENKIDKQRIRKKEKEEESKKEKKHTFSLSLAFQPWTKGRKWCVSD